MANRIGSVTVKCYGVANSTGDLEVAACCDASDLIYICLDDNEGEQIIFEAEAYHLENWAYEHDFEFFYGEQEVDFILESD